MHTTAEDSVKSKYFAFISYSTKDTVWGKRLQRKLENFRLPATLCSKHGWKRRPIKPVFFAPTDIQPGDLDEELKGRLRESRNLIVICSPNSARSEWVGKEIAYFCEIGRASLIHFFIVGGIPGSGDPTTECFNPVIGQLEMHEILGANIHERNYRWSWLNRERAYVQLISKLLGIEFDSIWRRHRRRLISKIIAWLVGLLIVIALMVLIIINSRPFSARIPLEETPAQNDMLPPLSNAVVTLQLDNETKTDTLLNATDVAEFRNIPHKYLGNKVRITFSCPDFLTLDTVLKLDKNVTLKIHRDPAVYGDICTEIYDFRHSEPVADTKVIIDGRETQSDSEGKIRMFIPLEEQKAKYVIEIPRFNKTDTITMPTNEYNSIGI